jgi:ubiquinone/menaquinone biosynthesis C-methylase UbiE
MTANASSWQDPSVAHRFLDERRAAIPFTAAHVEILLRLIRHFLGEPARVLDLGCGDGFLARAVLSAFPDAHALLLDHSVPMLDRARQAMAPFAGRYQLAHADLAAPLADAVQPGGFDLVVSGFAIHHLPHERKRSLYAEIHSILRPGGLFVNVEHVASATPVIERLFDDAYIDHIAAHSGKPRAQVAAEYHGRPDKADNILAPMEAQLDWLREAGFAHVDCFFRWLELAVFGGQRPQANDSSAEPSLVGASQAR